MSDKVGLVGVGGMGLALLVRLRLAGKQVRAYDPSDQRRALAREGGAEPVSSPGEAARDAAYIHVFVASDEQAIDACSGAQGVIGAAPEGAVIFLHSTILPETTRRIGALAAARKLHVLDAAVTAVPPKVQEGAAVFLVGGDAEIARVAEPHLRALGRSVQYFGPLGAGNIAKLAKNMVNAAERVALGEALIMTESGGIDARQFLEMMRSADHGSQISRWEKIFAVDGLHAEPLPATNLYNKDVLLADQFAQDAKLDLPIARGAAATAVRWVRKWTGAKA